MSDLKKNAIKLIYQCHDSLVKVEESTGLIIQIMWECILIGRRSNTINDLERITLLKWRIRINHISYSL